MQVERDLLRPALIDPGTVASLSAAEWELLIRQARSTGLLARLHVLLAERGRLEALPQGARNHLSSARAIADHEEKVIRWEVNRIQRALAPTAVPIILLKGAAYVFAELPLAKGRLSSDVDIMAPRAQFEIVEQALMRHGWEHIKLDEYDQRYYRTWTHELPPLRHRERKTVIDVHHTILPITSRLRPDPLKLWESARDVDGAMLKVLAPADMLLHSAAHIFQDGALERGLRDLIDLDGLLCHFGSQPGFWKKLIERAEELGLSRPLAYALRYSRRYLDTPVPDFVLAASQRWAGGWPVVVMDRLVRLALMPNPANKPVPGQSFARWLLYVRSHWLRMPPGLLARHLLRKSLLSWTPQRTGRVGEV